MNKIKSTIIMALLVVSVFFVINPVSASCPTVVINEVNFDYSDDWLEIYNYGPAIDMSGWTFTWEDSSDNGTYTIPNGFILGSKSFVLLREYTGTNTKTELYIGHNIGWADGEENTARLLDKNGKCIDYVRMEGSGNNPTPAYCSWGPPNITDTNTYDYVFRNSDTDTNTGSDWTKSNNSTPLALNPGQTGICTSKALPMDQILKILKDNKDKE